MTVPPKPTPEQIAVAIAHLRQDSALAHDSENQELHRGRLSVARGFNNLAAALEAVAKWLEEMK